MSAGMTYRWRDLLTVAFSSQQLLGQRFIYEDQGDQRRGSYGLFRHYQLMSFFRLPMKGSVDVKVIGVLKSVQSLKAQFDYGVQVGYKDIINMSALYRHANAVSFIMGINISSKISTVYSYEIPANGIGIGNTQGSHEFGISYRIR